MIQVLALELVGLKKLDCNLYNDKGHIVYKKGTELTSEMVMILNQVKIFRANKDSLVAKDKKSSEENPPEDKKPEHLEEESPTELSNVKSTEQPEKNLSVQKNQKTDLNLTEEEDKPSRLLLKRKHFNELYREMLLRGVPPGKIKKELEKLKQKQQRQEALFPSEKDELISFETPKQKAHREAVQKEIEIIRQLEPKKEITEFKSAVGEERKQYLLANVQEVLYSAINSMPMDLNPCVDTVENILNEVYTKLCEVNNFNELRIHDYYTFTHGLNVAILSAIIGRELGFNENKLKDLTFAAFLHDTGKMQIPREILYKKEKLTDQEMGLVKTHAELGYDFLVKKLNLPYEIASPALEHHEKWEGEGYPRGLKKTQISEFAQIVAIADVYDALVSDKVYRDSVQSVDAMRILLTEESGSFNPDILNRFIYLGVIKVGLSVK